MATIICIFIDTMVGAEVIRFDPRSLRRSCRVGVGGPERLAG